MRCVYMNARGLMCVLLLQSRLRQFCRCCAVELNP